MFKWIGGDAFDCNIIVIIKYNCKRTGGIYGNSEKHENPGRD